MLAVTAIDLLDDTFAPVAAGKIEIDIGPAFAALIEKPFENQIVTHGIDRRDAETITNGTVGGAAAALHHDVVLAAEINNVPDNQKISGKTEFLNQVQFFFELTLDRAADRRVTLLRAKPGDRAQKRIHRVALRHGKIRKFIAKIFQRKGESFGQARGVFNRFRQIAKEFTHFAIIF